MNLRNFSSVLKRREALEEKTQTSLKNIGMFTVDESVASTKNCENMIGVAQIPLGIAGPLKVKSKKEKGKSEVEDNLDGKEYYIPLATTEGALVASINRGCKVITESGGATVFVERVGITRGPVFKTNSLAESFVLKEWIDSHTEEIAKCAEGTSSHLRFISGDVHVVGNLVFVRFSFDTQDAMGMNMATIAVQAIADFIHEKALVKCLAISGNFCVDKKPSWQNTINGRGFRAWSEVFIPTNILTAVLKVTSDALFQTWEAKCMIGSAITGTMGYNGHAANVVASLFLATGQDPAHVVEGSAAITTMEKHRDGIFVRVFMPSVIVGTIGGGTSLATQKEALEILGVYGGKDGENAKAFAGIVSCSVLAGELSELSALATGSLTKAHQQLGRGKQ